MDIRKISKIQRLALETIGLNGTLHIQKVEKKLEINYATTHRSITRLEKINLIWLSSHDPNRSKGPKFFSLTPYGIVELFLRGKLREKEQNIIIHNWKEICPRYLLYWKDLKDNELLNDVKIILNYMYPNIVMIGNRIRRIPWRKNLLQLHKNSLDINLLFQIFENKEHNISIDKEFFIEVLNKDNLYYEVWNRYYGTKKLLMDNLHNINEKYFDNVEEQDLDEILGN
jgi:hypothetical protein